MVGSGEVRGVVTVALRLVEAGGKNWYSCCIRVVASTASDLMSESVGGFVVAEKTGMAVCGLLDLLR